MIDLIHNTLGWVLTITSGLLFLYVFTLISWRCCEDCLFKKTKKLFLYLSGFMLTMSAMPILLINKNYETKFYFENIIIIMTILIIIESIRLLKVIIEKNGN